jgi:hypothetical protein
LSNPVVEFFPVQAIGSRQGKVSFCDPLSGARMKVE